MCFGTCVTDKVSISQREKLLGNSSIVCPILFIKNSNFLCIYSLRLRNRNGWKKRELKHRMRRGKDGKSKIILFVCF